MSGRKKVALHIAVIQAFINYKLSLQKFTKIQEEIGFNILIGKHVCIIEMMIVVRSYCLLQKGLVWSLLKCSQCSSFLVQFRYKQPCFFCTVIRIRSDEESVTV